MDDSKRAQTHLLKRRTADCRGSLKMSVELTIETVEEKIVLELQDHVPADVSISKEPDNRLEKKPDGLYVRDRLDPDPVAYYLLSRG